MWDLNFKVKIDLLRRLKRKFKFKDKKITRRRYPAEAIRNIRSSKIRKNIKGIDIWSRIRNEQIIDFRVANVKIKWRIASNDKRRKRNHQRWVWICTETDRFLKE